MRRNIFSCLAVLIGAVPGWAGAESCFETRTHDFGPTPRGPQLLHYFQFTNKTKETLTIGSLRVSCGCVVASAPVAHIKPGESSYITARMDSRRFVGHKAVTIYVDFIAPIREEVTLLVQANGRDDISIYPETLAFGVERKGAETSTTVQVTLRNSGIAIENVKCESKHVKAEAKLLKNNGAETTYEIKATLASTLPPGRWRSEVWLQTNSRELGTIRIPLSVEIHASVTASPEAVQLGDVKMGDSVEQNVMIRGDKPFRIKAVRGADGGLKISGVDSESRKVHVLRIEYKPSAPGEIKQAIAIITEDSDEPAVTIPFEAKAIRD